MNCLATSTQPDIEYAVHQCAQFTAEPREEQKKALQLIGQYLLSTKNKGMICKSMTCYVDASANFAGDWLPEAVAEHDSNAAWYRLGYVILYFAAQ